MKLSTIQKIVSAESTRAAVAMRDLQESSRELREAVKRCEGYERMETREALAEVLDRLVFVIAWNSQARETLRRLNEQRPMYRNEIREWVHELRRTSLRAAEM